jgi:hypothetical protein
MYINACTMVIPIAQKETSFATFFLCFRNEPIYKIGTVLIVLQTVRLQSKVDISEHRGFFK